MSTEVREVLLEAPAAPEIVEGPSDDAIEAPPAAAGVSVGVAAATTALAAGAGAWLTAQLFLGWPVALAIGLIGVAVGVGLCAYSYRLRRATPLQYAVLPVALVVGAALVAPDARGGSASLTNLIVEAVRNGGLLQAPVSLDPGWRFILVVLFAALAALTLLLTVGSGRARLAVMLPLPVVIGAALLQPKTSLVAPISVAVVLVFAALAVAASVDVRGGRPMNLAFEARRLGKGAALMLLLVGGLVAVSRADFLFPDTQRSQVVPAQRPPFPPPQPDRVLFSTDQAHPGPWRVGVLDGIDAQGYLLLPPLDPSALRTLSGRDVIQAAPIGEKVSTVRVTVSDLPGHELPVLADPVRVSGVGGQLVWDPRADTLKLNDRRLQAGQSYTLYYTALPSGAQMSAAPPPPVDIAATFERAPAPPASVRNVLEQAPPAGFDRLQYVRQRLYSKVVAAGAGQPGPITPAMVDAMLGGGEASPYQITAAEVLLARWAGFPARMGYGFDGGSVVHDHLEFRPHDGAAWLEVYFQGYGWVPVTGTPPHARQNLDNNQKKHNPAVQATDELALTVYVPIKTDSLLPFYAYTRYWAERLVPAATGLALVIAFYPFLLKMLRSGRRRRWGRQRGLPARVGVAYAEFRDACNDLNLGDPSLSPLGFLSALEPDDEHAELAWLVTRALWGDLSRDLAVEDAEAAEDMSRSLLARLRAEQPVINRILAAASRVSLRDPYTREVPNLWPRRRLQLRLPMRAWRREGRRMYRRVAVLLPASLGVMAAVLAGACAPGSTATGRTDPAPVAAALPARIVPDQVLGYTVTRASGADRLFAKPGSAAAVSAGRVYTFRDEVTVEGSLQVSIFKPDIDSHDPAEQRQLLAQISTGNFLPEYFGTIRLWTAADPELRFYVWFPPDRPLMELFVFRRAIRDDDAFVRQTLAYQLGLTLPQQDLGAAAGGSR